MFTGIVEELGEVVAVEWGRNGTESAVLRVRGPLVTSDATHGASIAVNGVCLTVVEHDAATFAVDVMAETLDRSSLGSLAAGDRVNLERAMAAGGRLGGHIVQGHVDGTARLLARTPGDRWEVVRFSLPADLSRYVVEKGSITVDGVSLTVSAMGTSPAVTSPAVTRPAVTSPAVTRPGDERGVDEPGGVDLAADERGVDLAADERGVDPATADPSDEYFDVSLIPTTLALTTLGHKEVGDAVNLEVDVIAKYVERLMGARA